MADHQNASGILDKVLTSQHEREKQVLNPQEVIIQFFKQLTSKESDVLKRRYALNGQEKETLESIGASYEVTRERIRQIESIAIRKIQRLPQFEDLVGSFDHVVSNLLTEHGGLMSEELLLEKLLMEGKDNNENRRATLFLLSEILGEKFNFIPENKEFRSTWKAQTISMDFWREVVDLLTQMITSHGKPMHSQKIMEMFSEHEFARQNEHRLSHDVIVAFLSVPRHISRNPFNEYGLTDWGLVVPRRMNDKIMLILEKEDRPLHFREIAKKISHVFSKTAYAPTVHNELILNEEYVLVGRGIYALKSWGYQPGVVADVLCEVIRKAGKPLTRKEIVEGVLKQRIVKKNTIHLALTDRKRFKKTDDGRYVLATEASETSEGDQDLTNQPS